MRASLKVVILVGSMSEPMHLIASELGEGHVASALADAIGSAIELSLICWTPPKGVTPFDHVIALSSGKKPLPDQVLARLGAHGAKRVLSRFPAGRLLNSLGPVDQSRVFWRAINQSVDALKLLAASDIVIAGDLPAVKTAWTMLHQAKVDRAFYGLPSAINELSRLRALPRRPAP